MNKIWKKCGKIIANSNGHIVQSRACPCPYYAVIGVISRATDNECSVSSQVSVYFVQNGKIMYNGECIEINCKIGKSAEKTFNNTIYTFYTLLIEEDETKFKQKFYSECGYTENYPSIFNQNNQLTYQARNCINNYWLGYFRNNYLLNFQLNGQIRGQCWWQQAGMHEEAYTTYYYDYCYNEDDPYDDCQGTIWDGDRIASCGGNCTKHTYEEKYPDHTLSVGSESYFLDPAGYDNLYYIYVRGGGYWDGHEYHETCGDYQNALSTMSSVNSQIEAIAQNKNAYVIYPGSHWYYGSKSTGGFTETCSNSNKLCIQFSYGSGAFDNYYGDIRQVSQMYRWGRFKISRTANTPNFAQGVKFKMIIKDIKQNTGLGNESYSEETSTSTISLTFGNDWNQSLPLATDITLWTLLKNVTCSGDNISDYSIESQPIVNDWAGEYGSRWNQNVKTETIQVKLVALEYI